ncbi:MAG: ABC transporter permease subunit [Proteobacteria bacterium]|nr:ABC transporter permease subunit [Pseudomonadota bacterium]
MMSYALRRLAGLIPTLIVIVTVSFVILRLAPGGPFDQERRLAPEVRANLERAYGLDRPLGEQYLQYVSGLAHGDFGVSLREADFTVGELIRQGLPVSATLGVAALLIALVLGVGFGIAAAVWQGRPAAGVIAGGSAVALALPAFVTGPVLVLGFALHLNWFPAGGWASPPGRYLALPALTLALPLAAALTRLTRASLLEVLRLPSIRAARARGLSGARVLMRHALPPALIPVVSYLGPAFAFIVTGSLVVETVFGLPGTGRYLVHGAIDRDYPLVMGMIVIYAVLTLAGNFIADLLHGLLDPLVRTAEPA